MSFARIFQMRRGRCYGYCQPEDDVWVLAELLTLTVPTSTISLSLGRQCTSVGTDNNTALYKFRNNVSTNIHTGNCCQIVPDCQQYVMIQNLAHNNQKIRKGMVNCHIMTTAMKWHLDEATFQCQYAIPDHATRQIGNWWSKNNNDPLKVDITMIHVHTCTFPLFLTYVTFCAKPNNSTQISEQLRVVTLRLHHTNCLTKYIQLPNQYGTPVNNVLTSNSCSTRNLTRPFPAQHIDKIHNTSTIPKLINQNKGWQQFQFMQTDIHVNQLKNEQIRHSFIKYQFNAKDG
jgi:hypothetical protein